MKVTHYLIVVAVLLLSLSACRKQDDLSIRDQYGNPVAERGHVAALEKIGTIDLTSLRNLFTRFHYNDIKVCNEVVVYRLTYSSVYGVGNTPRNTQAIMLLPAEKSVTYMLEYTHGAALPIDMFYPTVPSQYNMELSEVVYKEIVKICIPMAANGYSVVMPDYMGYGITNDLDHPFVYNRELFKANLDAARAMKSALDSLGYAFDDRLFLAGWSEGAGTALASMNYIEADYSSEFDIVAMSGLAGPYSFESSINDLFSHPNRRAFAMPLYTWPAYVINKFSGLNRPTDQIFSYKVVDQESAIASSIYTTPSEVFQRYFMDCILDGSDTDFIEEIVGNTFSYGWKPEGKVFLHHGDNDPVVPYYNSKETYDNLKAMGADITLYTYSGGDHGSAIDDFAQTTIIDFNKLR